MQPDFDLPGYQEFNLIHEVPTFFRGPRIRGGQITFAIKGEDRITLQTLRQNAFTLCHIALDFRNSCDIQGFQEKQFLVSFITLKNNVHYFIEGIGSVFLKAGHFIIFRSPGQKVTTSVEKEKEHTIFTVSWSEEIVRQTAPFFPFLEKFINRPFEANPLTLGKSPTKAGPKVLGLIHELLNNPYDEQVLELFYENKIRDLLLDMMVEKGKRPVMRLKTTSEDQKKIFAIGGQIRTELNKKFPIALLARQAGMSEVKLKIAFKETFGKAIFEYQLAARMEEARRLLLESNMTTKSIASKVGYRNTTSFISKFRDHFGYPPGTIQK